LGSQDDLTAQVSAYCPLHKSTINTLMCGEYITLRGARESMEYCGELVNSLMLTDLPQYIWWKAHPHPDKPLFQSLASAGHSLIVDSAYLHRVEDGLMCYEELIARGSAVADLNWQRLLPWQELTASAFDPPERRNDLLVIDRLTIDYEKGNAAQALLFTGWFASRLGWTPVAYRRLGGDYDVRQVDFQSPQGHLATTELGAIPIGDPGEIAGDLIGIRVSSGGSEEHTCAILCSETTGCMRMEAAVSTRFHSPQKAARTASIASMTRCVVGGSIAGAMALVVEAAEGLLGLDPAEVINSNRGSSAQLRAHMALKYNACVHRASLQLLSGPVVQANCQGKSEASHSFQYAVLRPQACRRLCSHHDAPLCCW
jgi:glucose-6-phosphate dehydrogenase assembly protein OpcA